MQGIVEVPFYSDNIQAVREGEQVWVVVKRVCEALAIDPEGQRQRLRDPSRAPWAVTCMTQATGPDGKTYEVFALDLKSLPLWLATIDAGRVKPEARFQLVAYQRECADVLARHFFGAPESLAALTAAVRSLVETVARLQNNQAALWQKFGEIAEQIPVGGAIPAARFNALIQEIRTLADLEIGVGRWGKRRAALADIRRELGEVTAWGGKGRPWNEMPAAVEPAARALLRRRTQEALKRLPPGGAGKQLSLLKSG